MMNEEMKAVYESLHSVEDAYNLVKENGYTGSMDDFLAMCAKAADDMSMDMDDMDQVAGGSAWDTVTDTLSAGWDKLSAGWDKTWAWAKANPGAAAGIVGGTITAAAGILYVVNRPASTNTNPVVQNNEPLRESLASIHSENSVEANHNFDDSDLNVSNTSAL